MPFIGIPWDDPQTGELGELRSDRKADFGIFQMFRRKCGGCFTM
jgi:hypothetical protein